MSIALAQRGSIVRPGISRESAVFAAKLASALRDPRFIWLPSTSAYKADVDHVGDAVITLPTAQPGRVARLGNGFGITFNGATDGAAAPTSLRYSFNSQPGNTDLPFSCGVVANVTSTATQRALISKWNNAPAEEWLLCYSATTNLLQLQLHDQSAAITVNTASNASPGTGSWLLLGSTYSGLGGATAANGIALYSQGLAVASTATNNASYVAMEQLAANLGVGQENAVNSRVYSGSLALGWVSGVQLSAAEMRDIYWLCHDFYGI